ncbi:Melibiase-domain-containing protein [Microdochium bolleyi]|uniref:Alpha-galactosidase n=1 Tax=Microdochium bolleyi TaxID=196109 RepID=A0A136JCQ4_9PEZI|nr:Melibiase-domain-containing protein [Microdochium bolleyi]
MGPSASSGGQAIVVSSKDLTFALNGHDISYRFHVDPDSGDLISTHFGGRVDEDGPGLARSFGVWSPKDHSRRREFPDLGRGDFRVPAVHIRHASGYTVSRFRYQSHSVSSGKPSLEGLPCTFGTDGQVETLAVRLHDEASGVSAELSYSVFAEHDAIARSVKVTNGGDKSVTVEKLASMSFDLPAAADDEGYHLVGLHGEWGRERQPVRSKIRPGVQGFASTQGASSHWQNPFFALCSGDATETHGDAWGVALVYSGSHQSEIELGPRGSVRANIGMNPLQLSWPLEPGQSLSSPECIAVYSGSGLGDMSRKLHRLVRNNLMRSNFAREPRPVLLNPWEGITFNFDDKALYEIAEQTAQLGIKLFVIDDGWFGDKHLRVDDHAGLGDWVPNPKRFPDGMGTFARNIRCRHGLQLGLWIEPEMVNKQSELFEAHPDWVLEVGSQTTTPIRHQFVLDLGRSEVQLYLIDAISTLLKSAPIRYVKWDFNRPVIEAPSPASYHKYMLGLYRVLSTLLHERHLDVLWEGCASGGGRFDLGMLHYFPQIWTSDNTDALDRVLIQMGTSLAYPACSMGAHVSRSPNEVTHREASLTFRAHVAMMGGSFGVELDPRKLSGEERETLPGLIKLGEKVNPIVVQGDMYRLALPEKSNFPAVLFLSVDGRQGVLFLFQIRLVMMSDRPPIRLQGLDPQARYAFDDGREFSGRTLMNAGIVPGVKTDLTSEMIILTKL